MPALVAMGLGLAMIPFAEATWAPVDKMVRVLPFYLTSAAAQFPTGLTALVLALAIGIENPRARRTVGVFLLALAVNWAVVQTTKEITCRVRPEYSIAREERHQARVESWMLENPKTRLRTEARDQWLWMDPHRPRSSGRPDFWPAALWPVRSALASFPSGHASAAFVFAAWLCLVFPRSRAIWFALAVLAAVSRVYARRHWIEDSLVGAGMGWMIAWWVFSRPWAEAFGARVARWLPGRSNAG